MDGQPPDLGKLVLPGYINADPPKEPQFALTAGGSGQAASIGQAGGSVAVNGSGGISLTVPGLATIGIDPNNDITLASGDGVINILTEGLGNDVNILNAGTIAFDIVGAGAIQNVQTINGIVYPPPGGGGGTSISQASSIVACLGNGAILISSIGAGASVDIVNAGRISFDTAGLKDISGVSTINGARYIPAGSISSISNGLGYAKVDASGNIALQTAGNAFLTLFGTDGVVPNKVVLTSGASAPEIVLGASGSNDIAINNPFSTTPSFMTMTADGTVAISGAAVNITNLSTVNGSAYPPNFVIPSDITVSTLTAASYVSTLGIQGVSSITNVGANIDMNANVLNLYGATATLGDGFGAGFEVASGQNRIIGINGLVVDANLSVSTITDVSTINGAAYPPLFTTIGDIATGGFVSASTSNVLMGVGATALSIDSGNALTVGSVTADTSIVYASTIQASASGLSIFETTAGANVKLDTGARVKFNEGFSTITDGTGLIVGLEGSSLGFPLDTTGTFGVGAIEGLSTINGAAYPAAPAAKQATYYKSVSQNLTSPNTDITFDLSGSWNNPGGYITHQDSSANFIVVQTGLYQLEFNLHVIGSGSTYSTASKSVFIDITRSPSGQHAIIGQSAQINSGGNYSQSVSATYYLEAGDDIVLRVNNVILSGTPVAQGITNTFDLNTFFTWRYIP